MTSIVHTERERKTVSLIKHKGFTITTRAADDVAVFSDAASPALKRCFSVEETKAWIDAAPVWWHETADSVREELRRTGHKHLKGDGKWLSRWVSAGGVTASIIGPIKAEGHPQNGKWTWGYV